MNTAGILLNWSFFYLFHFLLDGWLLFSLLRGLLLGFFGSGLSWWSGDFLFLDRLLFLLFRFLLGN